jgi:hypothetical protein
MRVPFATGANVSNMFKSDTHYTHSGNEFTIGQWDFIISDAITEYPWIGLASTGFHNRIARVGWDGCSMLGFGSFFTLHSYGVYDI